MDHIQTSGVQIATYAQERLSPSHRLLLPSPRCPQFSQCSLMLMFLGSRPLDALTTASSPLWVLSMEGPWVRRDQHVHSGI